MGPDRDSTTPRARSILAVVPGSFVSGAELLLLRDLAAARAAGWGVRVACAEGPLVARLHADGMEHVTIPELRLGSGSRWRAGGSLARATIGAARALRRARRTDEVWLVNGVNALPAAVLGAARRAPVVYYAHDVLVRRDRLLLARLARRAIAGALAVSDAAGAPLRALGITTIVVRQGTEWPVDAAAPPAERRAPPRIGIAAVITPWKGHAVLLEAMAGLRHRDAELDIMGATAPKDADHAAALRSRAAADDLRGRVHFLGHVATPLAQMRTWTVAVVASVDPEAGPLSALEAMSVGVPIVGTEHGGIVEVLGDAGVLVAPHDAAALQQAIDNLLDDDALYARCAAAGPRRIVEAHLTRAEHEQRFVEGLATLATAAPARRARRQAGRAS